MTRWFSALLVLATPAVACSGPTEAHPGAVQRDERARIEALLAAVAKRTDVTFIRNGSEHTASEAADHLRSKWAGAAVTAEQFIERYGTKSSTTGRPYRVRIGGTERDASGWLRELLTAVAPR